MRTRQEQDFISLFTDIKNGDVLRVRHHTAPRRGLRGCRKFGRNLEDMAPEKLLDSPCPVMILPHIFLLIPLRDVDTHCSSLGTCESNGGAVVVEVCAAALFESLRERVQRRKSPLMRPEPEVMTAAGSRRDGPHSSPAGTSQAASP